MNTLVYEKHTGPILNENEIVSESREFDDCISFRGGELSPDEWVFSLKSATGSRCSWSSLRT